MEYHKILEVREDADRVYFSFFASNQEKYIIGVPKYQSENQNYYAGNDFKYLRLTDVEVIRRILPELTKKAMSLHPAANSCSPKAIAQIF